ncbi:regulator of microtubule dynamics protein 1-like isoform X2 [Ornithodoros turicata]|uniref:regulator of microtubule dynamics protein 1-like isoform X2 n=1 Tax=Ornithodoros turicata TaxID=34597 RepID=UPI003139C452
MKENVLPWLKARPRLIHSFVPSVFLLHSFTLFKMSEDERVKQEVDCLHKSEEHKAAYDILIKYKDSKDPEMLWRVARVIFKCQEHGEKKDKEAAINEALSYLDKALSFGGGNIGQLHKWYAALLGSREQHHSLKEKIQEAHSIRDHITKAVQLTPSDPSSFHILGKWCFEVAAVPWYTRKAAKMLVAELPMSTYEEALKNFMKAEELQPNFYSRNTLMIGKVLLEMNKRAEGVQYLRKARDYQPKVTVDDELVSEEAKKLLENVGES